MMVVCYVMKRGSRFVLLWQSRPIKRLLFSDWWRWWSRRVGGWTDSLQLCCGIWVQLSVVVIGSDPDLPRVIPIDVPVVVVFLNTLSQQRRRGWLDCPFDQLRLTGQLRVCVIY